ncbi:MAG: MiaB/RimO family radical SAM methylthiotransferase [Phycisphaerales bacterium]
MSPSSHHATGRRVYMETFGCQMNELDSELVRGQLVALGYSFVEADRDADIILYNTCSVREQAENKAYSRIGIVGQRKRSGEHVLLGVIGCMAERDGVAMLRRHPQIDLLCGPGELDRLPQLIDNAAKVQAVARLDRLPERSTGEDGRGPAGRDIASVVALQGNRNRRTATLAAAEDSLELLDLSRAFDPDHFGGGGGAPAGGRAAYVRITRGCNKFCTYCVVPNTRGPEVHRPPDHIVDECRRLADAGVVEVTLLGQTVNHYVYVHGAAISVDGREAPQVGPGLSAFRDGGRRIAAGQRVTTFAALLKRIHDEVPAIKRLRFVTSYPRDFGDDALSVIAESPRICRYLHVPPQSGSDRILKLMNRGYAVGEYLDFIDRARSFLPDAGISGDFIVGFPTETDDDFAATVALLERVRFKNSFIFKYSPRPGTTAIERFEDDVPDEVKRWRNNHLLAVQGRISAAEHRALVGRTLDVFVERVTDRSEGGMAASTDTRSNEDRRAHTPGRPTIELGWESRPRAAAAAGTGFPTGQDSVAGRAAASTNLLQMVEGEGSITEVADAPARSPAPMRPNTRGGRVQLSGRTGSDVIVVFDLPAGTDPVPWLGRIVPVQIENAAALLLSGTPKH